MKNKQSKNFYRDLHKWLEYHYGKATKCEKCNKKGKGREIHWALLKGKEYERKRENFIQLCIICHGKYDDTLIKKGTHLSSKTEFKKGRTPWNKGLTSHIHCE